MECAAFTFHLGRLDGPAHERVRLSALATKAAKERDQKKPAAPAGKDDGLSWRRRLESIKTIIGSKDCSQALGFRRPPRCGWRRGAGSVRRESPSSSPPTRSFSAGSSSPLSSSSPPSTPPPPPPRAITPSSPSAPDSPPLRPLPHPHSHPVRTSPLILLVSIPFFLF